MNQNIPTHFPDLVESEVASHLRADLRKNIIAVNPDNSIGNFKFKKGQTNNLATFAAWHKACDASFPGAIILNELPFSDALKIYAAALRQPVMTRQ